MAKRSRFPERIVGNVAVGRHAVGRDWIEAIGAVENPPPASAPPIDPGVTRARIFLGFADSEQRITIGEVVEQPERFRFAVAGLLRLGQLGRVGSIGVAGDVAETVADLHQVAGIGHGRALRLQSRDHSADAAKIAIVRGGSGGLKFQLLSAWRQRKTGTAGPGVRRGSRPAIAEQHLATDTSGSKANSIRWTGRTFLRHGGVNKEEGDDGAEKAGAHR